MKNNSLLIAAACLAPFVGATGSAFAANQSPADASVQSADEVRALVAQMLSDADGRSSLLQSGATAGHDGHFFLASADGAFRLQISGQLQFRYTANFRNDSPGTDSFENGFTTPRTALRFEGNIYEPNLIYAVQGVFNRTNGLFTLEDAYVGYQFDNGILLLWGQLREPILWEDQINETHALAVDESIVNSVFRQDRAQGAWIHYSADAWRMWAGVNQGIRSANTDLGAAPADWGVTTRWEWKFAGDWAQFNQFSSSRGSSFGGKLGGGVHFNQSPDRPGLLVSDTLAYSADLMVEGDGWNFFTMFVGLNTNVGGGSTFNDFGFLVQGGYFLTDLIEAFARYDAVVPDSNRPNDNTFNTITLGGNYYLHGQAAKFTIDVQVFLDSVASNDLVAGTVATSRGPRVGLFPSADDNQVAIRFQFQLLF